MDRYKNTTGSQKGVVALVDDKPVAVKIAAGATSDPMALADHPANNFHLGKGNIVKVDEPSPVEAPKKSKKRNKAE